MLDGNAEIAKDVISKFRISVFRSANKHLMHRIVSRYAWCSKLHDKSNQRAMRRNTVHTREDPEQDVNSNYC